MKLRPKPFFHLVLLFCLSFCVVWISSIISASYLETNLPEFDGVMYEKKQILRFLSFKQNYSFIERCNQAYYELVGNPVSGGFTALTCLVNPFWLNSGFNIIVRSFIALFFFNFALFKWFSLYLRPAGVWLLLVLVSQIPLFYNALLGLSSYVPDLSSGLSLFSAYLFLWLIIYRNIGFNYLYLIPLLISLAVFSRYNFFVYTALIFFPLLIPMFKFLNGNYSKIKVFYFLTYASFFIMVWSVYGILHFQFFLDYYAKPADYQYVDYFTSFYSLFKSFTKQLGLPFVILLFLIGLTIATFRANDKFRDNDFSLLWLMYPFTVLFIFLFLVLKATNQPHVYSIFYLFAFLVFFSYFLKKLFWELPCASQILSFSLAAFIFCNFFYLVRVEPSSNVYRKTNLKLADYLLEKMIPSDRFFLLHSAMLEIPIDVYLYRKKGYMANNDLMFYFTDWNFYDIDRSLDPEKIFNYYSQQIDIQCVKYISLPSPNKNTHNEISSFVISMFRKSVINDSTKWTLAANFGSVNDSSDIALYKRVY